MLENAMESTKLKITNESGLHARPASVFVQEAARFQSFVRVRNATRQSAWVDGKSILSVLTLGVEPGHEIDLQVEGEDEGMAFAALRQLIQSNFEGKL